MGSLNHPQWNTSPIARFTVGRDHRGWWVVHDRLGRIGGLFASEEAALHFAEQESNRHPEIICRAPDGAQVDLFEEQSAPIDRHAATRVSSIGHLILSHNRRLRRA
jgi:hypothetical protein